MQLQKNRTYTVTFLIDGQLNTKLKAADPAEAAQMAVQLITAARVQCVEDGQESFVVCERAESCRADTNLEYLTRMAKALFFSWHEVPQMNDVVDG